MRTSSTSSYPIALIAKSSIHKMSWLCSSNLSLLLLLLLSLPSLIVSLEFRANEKNKNVTDYLARILRQTKVEIAKEYMKGNDDDDGESVVTLSYDVKWKKLWSYRLKSDGALTLNMFNKMFILEGNRVMSVAIESVASNDSILLQPQIALIHHERPVKFAKSIVWKSRLYLLVCHENACCYLYTGKNDFDLRHRQIMKQRGSPNDAIFFTRANRLYLVVAHNTDQFPASSIIYHWTGTYMDIIQRITTVGAVSSVTAFNYKSSTMIVFGQNDIAQPDVGSEIYEFNENGIERIQYLSTNGPTIINHYYHNGAIFLFITNERESGSVYWWDGNEFLHWLDLPDIIAPRMMKILDFNSDTLFLVSYENSVCLYKVTDSEYSRLNLFELKNKGEKVVDIGVWIDEKKPVPPTLITLLLVTIDVMRNLYRIEPWELHIKKIVKNNAAADIQEAVDATEECLLKLQTRLEDRTIFMEKLSHETWSMLLPSAENVTISNKIDGTSTSDKLHKIQPIPSEAELIFRSGRIIKLDISSSAAQDKDFDATIISPLLMSVFHKSRKILQIHGENSLTGNVIIESDAKFLEFHTNAIEISNFNDKNTNLENSSMIMISARGNQNFSKLHLNGQNIIVHELEIDTLCGIPHDYWLHIDDENFNEIFVKNKNWTDVIVNNDTILVQKNSSSFGNIKLRTIESVHLPHLFDNLFILGEEHQLIKGNIFQRSIDGIESKLNVIDIVIEGSINAISLNHIITRATEQNISGNVFVKRMLMENIVVTRLNGIAITNGDGGDAAMVSKKNHLIGQVAVANLRVLDQLAIDSRTKFPKFRRPVQIYDSLTVFGNIKMKDLTSESATNFALWSSPSIISQIDDSNPINITKDNQRWNIDSIVNLYWTKSTSQTVENGIYFNQGLRIDELRINLLNNLDTNVDIMLTSSQEIDEKKGLIEFRNFTAIGSIVDATNDGTNFVAPVMTQLYDDSIADALFFNQVVRIQQLGVQQLYIESFNGIPLDDIMRQKNIDNRALGTTYIYRFADDDLIQKFDTITVADGLEMENLDFTLINGVNNQGGNNPRFLQFDANYHIHYLKDEKLTFGGNVEMADFFASFSRNKLIPMTAWTSIYHNISSLTIGGDLLIEGEAKVVMINDTSTLAYLDGLAKEQLTINSDDMLMIENLTVRHDLSLIFLRGSRLESLITSIVSKSRMQNLTNSRFNFFGINVADDLQVERINNHQTHNFIHVDSYDINFGSDVSFGNLNISSEPNIRTKYLNGFPLTELYEKLGNISSRIIDNLRVQGNISWQTHGDYAVGGETLETIMRHALRWRNQLEDEQPLHQRQIMVNAESTIIGSGDKQENIITSRPTRVVLVGSMKFFEPSSMDFWDGRIGADIRKIISDSVVDDPFCPRGMKQAVAAGILINSSKSFKKHVTTISLSVPENGEIGIHGLNKWRVNDLNSSIVRIDSLTRNRNFVSLSPRSGSNSHEKINDEVGASATDAQPDQTETTMIFRHEVEATKLVIENGRDSSIGVSSSSPLLIHGLPISQIVTGSRVVTSLDDIADKYLPSSTYLKHLVIQNNAFVNSLDSTDFDEFVSDRVSRGDNKFVVVDSPLQPIDEPIILINGNIQYNGRVRVSDEASIGKINGIAPSHLVINDSPEDEIILGNETHIYGNIAINGETYASLVAGINLKDEYDNAVLNNDNVEIFSDITFQAEFIEMTNEASPVGWKFGDISGGFVNEIRLKNLIEKRDTAEGKLLREIGRNESRLEAQIVRAWNASNNLSEIFYYLESEDNLLISGMSNIERVDITRIENSIILGMYGNEVANYCGLANDCPCRRTQYVAEIMSNNKNCQSWKVEPPHQQANPRIFYHFHEANGAFAVSIATTTVSSSQRCSRLTLMTDSSSLTPEEFTTISWMKQHRGAADDGLFFNGGSNITKDALTIYDGYLSDARVFTHNGLVFIVLAIYYDPIRSSHQTNSLIYVLDLTTDVIKLAQTIPTYRASSIQVFKIPGKGPHVLISSSTITAATITAIEQDGKGKLVNRDSVPAESLLYRLESAYTPKFRLLKRFPSGGNRHAKSVSRLNDEFLLLDDIATNSVNVYRYDTKWENFNFHQSIYHDSMAPIAAIETLYIGEFRQSQVYVIVTTERDQFFIYECTLMGKFRLITRKKVNGILSMVPFDVSNDRRYMFIGTDTNSTILRIVEQRSQH